MAGTTSRHRHGAASGGHEDAPKRPARAQPRLAFRLPLDPARLLRARQRVRDYLHEHGLESHVIDEVVLAVEEGMTNAVRHCGGDGVELRLGFEGRDLRLEISDSGTGFDVSAFDPEQVPDPLQPGGRGLFLMARLMDEIELVADDGLTVRLLRRDVLPERAGGGAAGGGAADSAAAPSSGPWRESRDRTLIEEIPEGFAALDWEYRFRYANQLGLAIYGLDREQVLGKTLWELFPHIEQGAVGDAFREAMELGRPSILEYDSPLLRRALEFRIYPAGTGVVLYLRDIEQRKRRERERDEYLAALQESESRFRSLFESMVEGVALHELVDVDGRAVDYVLVDVNPAYGRQTGIAVESARGTRASELYGTGSAPYLEDYARVVQTGEPFTFETYFAPLQRRFRVTAVALEGRRFATLFEDVTERAQAEARRLILLEELRRGEQRLRATVEQAAVGVAHVAPDGRFLLVNEKLCEITGYGRDELERLRFQQITHPDDLDTDEELVRRLLAGDLATYTLEKRYLRKDGEPVWISLTVSLVRDEDGQPDFFVAVIDDVSRRRQVEALRDESLRRSALLSRTAAALLSSSRPQDVVDGLCREVMEYLDCHVFFNYLVDEAAGRLRLNAFAGIEEGEAAGIEQLDFGVAVCGCAALDARRIMVEDVQHSDDDRASLVRGYGVQAYAAHPLLAHGRVLGTLSFGARDRTSFTDDELSLMATVADYVAIAVDRQRTEQALRDGEERLRLAKEATRLGVHDYDLRLGVIEWDARVRQLWGFPSDLSVTYERFMDGIHPDDRASVQAMVDAALDPAGSGEYEATFRVIDAQDQELRWVRATGQVHFDDGQAARLVGTVEDVTERKTLIERLQRRERLGEELNRINRLLATLTPSEQTFERLLAELSRALGAESAAIALLHDDVVRVAAVYGLPVLEGREFRLADLPVASIAADTSDPQAVEDIEHDARVVPEIQRSLGIRSVLVVPLAFGAEQRGQLYFNWHSGTRHFEPEEVDFARKAGANISVMLENARLYEEQQRIARTLQDNFIHPLPAVPGLDLAELSLPSYRPELVGGDFHDVSVLPDGRVMALVGDVMGKGIQAAGLTETVRSAVRALSLTSPEPERVLQHVCRLLLADEGEQFVAAVLVLLDPETGRGQIAVAGHPPPAYLTAGGASLLELHHGPPLGAFDVPYAATSLTLAPGEGLVLATDGLTEARRGTELFGEPRLLEVLRAAPDLDARGIVERLREAVVGFAGRLKDDLQVLALRRVP